VNRLRERIGAVAQQAEPALAAVAPGLTAAQLQHLQKHYERNDADWRKEWLDASRRPSVPSGAQADDRARPR
jgi:hypothetical protein